MTKAEATKIIERYLTALTQKDEEMLHSVLSNRAIQSEMPNALAPAGAERNKAQMLEGMRQGAQVLKSERYELLEVFVDGSRAACRLKWQGELNMPVLGKTPGETLEAAFAVFFSFVDGKIVEQTNYDCFFTETSQGTLKLSAVTAP